MRRRCQWQRLGSRGHVRPGSGRGSPPLEEVLGRRLLKCKPGCHVAREETRTLYHKVNSRLARWLARTKVKLDLGHEYTVRIENTVPLYIAYYSERLREHEFVACDHNGIHQKLSLLCLDDSLGCVELSSAKTCAPPPVHNYGAAFSLMSPALDIPFLPTYVPTVYSTPCTSNTFPLDCDMSPTSTTSTEPSARITT